MLSHILSEKPHVPVCFFADPEYGPKTFKTSRTYPTWAYFKPIEVFLGAFEEKKSLITIYAIGWSNFIAKDYLGRCLEVLI